MIQTEQTEKGYQCKKFVQDDPHTRVDLKSIKHQQNRQHSEVEFNSCLLKNEIVGKNSEEGTEMKC
jgi:hypothetical protein